MASQVAAAATSLFVLLKSAIEGTHCAYSPPE